MPNPLRRPRQALPAPSSLTLLATLSPRLSDHVTLSLHASRRLLEVRADYVLLYRRGALPRPTLDVSQLQLVQPLTELAASFTGSPEADTTLRLAGHKLSFSTPAAKQRLHALVQAATTAASSRSVYTLGAELGHGATSVVRAATRKKAGNVASQQVAVKLLSKASLLSEAGALRNLLAERAALLALSRSVHTVTLLDAYQTRSHVALVTELASLGDLQHALSRLPAKKFSVPAARALMAELVLAVGDAHRAGRVVRDVKLANALITASGRVRLADFGLAKALQIATTTTTTKDTDDAKREKHALAPDSLSTSSVTDSETGLTTDDDDDDEVQSAEPRFLQRAHSFVGTRRYMAPEVAASRTSKAGYGAAADVWALGIALHVLLTGRYPFRGEDGAENGVVGASETASLSGLRALDADAADLVGRMLCRDALERADLCDVRRHAFFNGVQWHALRDEVRRDTRSELVLRELRDGGVVPVLEREDVAAPHGGLLEEAGVLGPWELLGLEYLGEASH